MIQQDIPALLKEFEPFHSLGEDDLMILAGRSSIEARRKGHVLFERGDDDPMIHCLLEGSLELVAHDGRGFRVDAGTKRAAQPIGRLRPRQYTARAATPVRLILIDGTELGDPLAMEENGDAEILVEEMGSVEQSSSHAATLVATQLGERALELPSLPSVALATSRLIDRDEADTPAVAKIVMGDPAIAAKLVRAANSPLFYGRRQIDSCERAILRLGLRTTRQLVMAFAMRDLFRTSAAPLASRMEALWLHSTEIAAIAFVLARTVGGFDPDEAQLAGLLHDIGIVPVLQYVAGRPELVEDSETVDYLESELKADIGARLLKSWNFPAPLIAAARDAEQWWRDDVAEAEMADLVLVTQLIAQIGKPGLADVPAISRLPAFRKVVGDKLDPRSTMAILSESREQIEDIQSILRS